MPGGGGGESGSVRGGKEESEGERRGVGQKDNLLGTVELVGNLNISTQFEEEEESEEETKRSKSSVSMESRYLDCVSTAVYIQCIIMYSTYVCSYGYMVSIVHSYVW